MKNQFILLKISNLSLILILALFFLSSCKRNEQSGGKREPDNLTYIIENEQNIDTTLLVVENKPIIDSSSLIVEEKKITDSSYIYKSRFISGKQSANFDAIQRKNYYKNYQRNLRQSWNIVTNKNLVNIKKWSKKYPLVKNDGLTLFYPFSGPDFLYANAFFPNAQNYILIGLEKLGTLPDFDKMTDAELTAYLNKLHSSLRYANRAAYFMTKHMIEDFSSPHFNGVIHLISLYLAKTNHTIINIQNVRINHFGQLEEKGSYSSAGDFVKGINFTVLSPEGKTKNVYYFSADLSDSNLSSRIGLTNFLSKMGKKNVFVKSASYLLHNKAFTIIRDIVLTQSSTIIQDDTGIPFSTLLANGFDVQLFGNYTRTIGIFKNYFQKNLAQALNNKRVSYLPFKLGYNSWQGQMVLLAANYDGKKRFIEQDLSNGNELAENAKVYRAVDNKLPKKGLVYRVQIKTSVYEIAFTDPMFKGLPDLGFYSDNNVYKYTSGNFASYEQCKPIVEKAKNKGFKDAFIIAFYNQKRISLEKARRVKN